MEKLKMLHLAIRPRAVKCGNVRLGGHGKGRTVVFHFQLDVKSLCQIKLQMH